MFPHLTTIGAFIAAVSLVLASPPSEPPADGVFVDGPRLVDGEGLEIQLRGVNRSGTEYSCVQGWGIFDGPVDDEAIEAMADWGFNAVRIPLNEDCWLGDPRIDPAYSGASYRSAVGDYMERLEAAGMVVVVDLHWTGNGGSLATAQQPMARAGRSPLFWESVAKEFRGRQRLIFDVFNEPHDVSWKCWRDGCDGYSGMQDLVDAIRKAGASQPIILSGLDWGGDLRQWLEYRPVDPLNALIAGAHLYDFKRCVSSDCWTSEVGAITADSPVVITEFGDTDCTGDFSGDVMTWADASGVSYMAWSWNEWECSGGPALISSFDGTPTPFGATIRDHLDSPRPFAPTRSDRIPLIREIPFPA